MSYGRPFQNLANASFEGTTAYTRPAFYDADAQWFEPSTVDAAIACGTLLGAPSSIVDVWKAVIIACESMLSSPVALVRVSPSCWLVAATPLSQPSVISQVQPELRLAAPSPLKSLASFVFVQTTALASAPSMLGVGQVLFWNDFEGTIEASAPVFYVADLVGPGGTVRVPISSWQATLQTDIQSYVQCVIPAVAPFVADIESATEFVVYRRAKLRSGDYVEAEFARAPTQVVSLDGGPFNYTATVSGYTAPSSSVENPPAEQDRILSDVRLVSRNKNSVRVRCAVDWFLRPGMRALFGVESIIVSYVNYYCLSQDEYMDVGSRA